MTSPNARTPLGGHASQIDPTTSAEEALRRAGLDWEVQRRPLWYTGVSNRGKPVKVPGQYVTVRTDTEAFLGTVTERYTVMQNAEAFSWADGLGEYAFGGALRDGGQVYLGVKLDTVDVIGDKTDIYAVLWTGHDGRRSLSAMVTPIRIVCTNAMHLARSAALAKWMTTHTGDINSRAEEAQTELRAEAERQIARVQSMADRLNTPLKPPAMRRVLEQAMPGKPRHVDKVIESLGATTTLTAEQKNTGWGLYQAAVEYLEWGRAAKTAESGLQSMLDGESARSLDRLRVLLTREDG